MSGAGCSQARCGTGTALGPITGPRAPDAPPCPPQEPTRPARLANPDDSGSTGLAAPRPASCLLHHRPLPEGQEGLGAPTVTKAVSPMIRCAERGWSRCPLLLRGDRDPGDRVTRARRPLARNLPRTFRGPGRPAGSGLAGLRGGCVRRRGRGDRQLTLEHRGTIQSEIHFSQAPTAEEPRPAP